MSHPCATIEAESFTKLAHAQLLRVDLQHAVDATFDADVAYRLDMSLTPRPHNACLRYAGRWAVTRFERAGKLFVVPPGQILHARSGRGAHRILICRLSTDPAHELPRPPPDWNDCALAASLNIADGALRGQLERLAQELLSPGFASELLLELIASQVAIELTRFYDRAKQSTRDTGLAAWRLKLIEERLKEVHAAPSLSELAALCRLSVRQLSRGFRQSRGVTLGDYVANVRLEHAKQLLLAGQSVKAAALTLGFGSTAAFCFAFRRSTGQSPLQFRDDCASAVTERARTAG